MGIEGNSPALQPSKSELRSFSSVKHLEDLYRDLVSKSPFGGKLHARLHIDYGIGEEMNGEIKDINKLYFVLGVVALDTEMKDLTPEEIANIREESNVRLRDKLDDSGGYKVRRRKVNKKLELLRDIVKNIDMGDYSKFASSIDTYNEQSDFDNDRTVDEMRQDYEFMCDTYLYWQILGEIMPDHIYNTESNYMPKASPYDVHFMYGALSYFNIRIHCGSRGNGQTLLLEDESIFS